MSFLTWCVLWAGVALAEVSESEWQAMLGEEVTLENQQGRTLTGTIVRVSEDTVRIRRSSDGRLIEIGKEEVADVTWLDPDAGWEDPEAPAAQPSEPTEPAEPATQAAPEPQPPDVDAAADSLLDSALGPAQEGPEVEGEDPAELMEGAQDAASEAIGETPEPPGEVVPPRPTTSAPEVTPQPERPSYGPTAYQEGYSAGRIAAGDAGMTQPFLVGTAASAACTGAACVISPPLGCLGALAVGIAAPTWYGVVDPLMKEPDMLAEHSDEDPEYAVGYVRGYTDEVRQRQATVAAAGVGAGLLIGGVAGLIVVNQTGSLL